MTSITHGNNADFANVLTNDKAEKRRFHKLSEQYPEQVKVIASCPDGSTLYSIPWKWIILRKPITKNLSDEYRAELAERMKSVRENRW